MSRVAAIGLGVAGLSLAAVIAAEVVGSGPGAQRVVVLPHPASRHAASGRPEAGADARWVTTILARPLFDPSRRVPGGTVSAAGGLRLSGVVVGPSGAHAIFEPAAGGKPLVLPVGGRLGDAVVRAIRPDAVLVGGRDGPRVLRPSFGGLAPATAPGVAQPVPQIRSMAVRLMEEK